MIDTGEIQDTISELENGNTDWDTIQKLARLYIVRDHLLSKEPPQYEYSQAGGWTEIERMVQGKDPAQVWAVISDLMDTVKVLQPKLYDSVIRRIESIR